MLNENCIKNISFVWSSQQVIVLPIFSDHPSFDQLFTAFHSRKMVRNILYFSFRKNNVSLSLTCTFKHLDVPRKYFFTKMIKHNVALQNQISYNIEKTGLALKSLVRCRFFCWKSKNCVFDQKNCTFDRKIALLIEKMYFHQNSKFELRRKFCVERPPILTAIRKSKFIIFAQKRFFGFEF